MGARRPAKNQTQNLYVRSYVVERTYVVRRAPSRRADLSTWRSRWGLLRGCYRNDTLRCFGWRRRNAGGIQERRNTTGKIHRRAAATRETTAPINDIVGRVGVGLVRGWPALTRRTQSATRRRNIGILFRRAQDASRHERGTRNLDAADAPEAPEK